MTDPAARAYRVVAAFAAELVRRGVTDVVVSPGSRSTPLTVTLHAQPGLRTWVQLDERVAAFFALGLGRATGRPAVLVCTSGTAAANYLPAVIEAHHAGVPVIVCSADRPPELRGDRGASQTIDQVGLYGTATRWAVDLPVAGEDDPVRARATAARAVAVATGPDPGPVHLNWPLREPLEPPGAVPVEPAGAPAPLDDAVAPLDQRSAALVDELARIRRGVVVVGPWPGWGLDAEHRAAAAVVTAAAARGWPVLAESLTQIRGATPGGTPGPVVVHADLLLRHDTLAARCPELVVLLGRPPTTKAVRLWLERHRPERVVAVDPARRWPDPSFTTTDRLAAHPVAVCERFAAAPAPADHDWAGAWRRADAVAARTVDALATGPDAPLHGPRLARLVVDALPDGSVLVAANSMAVRELDAHVPVGTDPATGRARVTVVANRGAAGIDGLVATAAGIDAARPEPARRRAAPGGVPLTALLVGDLALLHDLSGLASVARTGRHLLVVCLDDDGGRIFSFLPIAGRGDVVDLDTLFRTPHGTDITALDGFAGIRARRLDTAADLAAAVAAVAAAPEPGVDLLVVPLDPDADVAHHRDLDRAVGAALAAHLGGPPDTEPTGQAVTSPGDGAGT